MAPSQRPNVIFILTDDQGPWTLGCSGNEEFRTPNIDRLAATGTRFENFFCTTPVCSPARAALMTGKIASQNGVHDWICARNDGPDAQEFLQGQTCYSDVLAAQGYNCGLSGKWHLGRSQEAQHGFSYWFCLPGGGSKYNDANMYRDGQLVTCPGYLTDVITDGAIRFIDQTPKDRPFYLSVNYNAPHTPWTGHPQDIVDSYDDCPFKTCPQEASHPWARPDSLKHMGNRESLKGYAAAITAMDLDVGRIIDHVEKLGLRQNTLIVFSSDNGYSCGHHGFWHKGNGTFPVNMYENSVKVPTVMSHPGIIPQGLVSPAMASQYDFMPTLMDYLKLPAVNDPTLPGRSFLPALLNKQDQAQQNVVVFDEYGPVRMIRTQEWKYVHRYPFGPHELYDLKNDSGERNNLIDDKSRQSLVEEMRKRLGEWFGRYVLPHRDGAHMPVYGRGQMRRIDEHTTGDDVFFRPEGFDFYKR